MFIIDSNKTIHLTRGDIATISVSASEATNPDALYIFKPGDIVRFMVLKKKDCNSILLSKCVEVLEDTEVVDITLATEDTKTFNALNKPEDYWYEIELNPDTEPQTIVGYDQDGPKIFRLYPEGVTSIG